MRVMKTKNTNRRKRGEKITSCRQPNGKKNRKQNKKRKTKERQEEKLKEMQECRAT